MKILVVAATTFEIEALMEKSWEDVHFLITGVGMVVTTFSLTQYLMQQHVDLVINAGVAGAFDIGVQKGTLFHVIEDCFSELGAEDQENFISIDALALGTQKIRSILPKEVENLVENLPKAQGITVNKVHGNTVSIQNIKQLYPNVTLESMESAAVMYVCDALQLPCLVLRSISNHVEPRNKDNWDISTAIHQLNNYLFHLLPQFKNI